MFKELHQNMKTRVAFNEELSESIEINKGVKQVDRPAPNLLRIYVDYLRLSWLE